VRIKDVISDKLAHIGPTATAIERLVVKVEAVVDAFTEAGEITVRLRRIDPVSSDSFFENVINRMVGRVEAVIKIPFEDDDDDDEEQTTIPFNEGPSNGGLSHS